MTERPSKLSMFKNLDYFGGKADLLIGGNSTYTTYFGAFGCVLAFGFILWYTYLVILKIFDRQHPQVNCRREFNMDEFVYNFEDANIIPIVVFYNKHTGAAQDPESLSKYATVTADLWYSSFDYDARRSIFKTEKFPVKTCNQIQNKQPYDWLFNNNRYSNMLSVFQCVELPVGKQVKIHGNRIIWK